MKVTNAGVPVDSLIDTVKAAVKAAGISATDAERALRVTSIQLVLNAVATTTAGAKLEFTVPVVGVKVKFGSSVTRQDTHHRYHVGSARLCPTPGSPGR